MISVSCRSFSLLTNISHTQRPFICHASRRFCSGSTSKPLRILFCGSDTLSSAVLSRLYKESKDPSISIASIDVLCRPGKRSGRGLKNIRELPIKATAQELGLRLHERDTFTGWTPPLVNEEPINLVVAVSFGLFVPRRILNAAEYGGLNVHPSLLPDLRGPSPIPYAILNGYTETGVSIQTCSTEAFDHGKVLLNISTSIPNPDKITTSELQHILMPPSCDILIDALRQKLYFNQSETPARPWRYDRPLNHAPKIKSEDMRLRRHMSAEEIVRIQRALGKVWTVVKLKDDSEKRVLLHDLEVCPMPDEMREIFRTQENADRVFRPLSLVDQKVEAAKSDSWTIPMMKSADGKGVIVTANGENALLIRKTTMDGRKISDAARTLWGTDLDVPEDRSWVDTLVSYSHLIV
jgi:methionyl-tRNA formyltransferase